MSTRRQVRDAFAELARGHVTDAQRVYPLTNDDGERVTRVLENGCTVVTGSTQTTDAQIPSITLPSSGCTMLRYIIKVRSGASGYTEFRVEKEGGVAFAGSYALGRIEVTDMQAGGMGF
jgi:hypothetical protein